MMEALVQQHAYLHSPGVNPGAGRPDFQSMVTGNVGIGNMSDKQEVAIDWLKIDDEQDKTVTMFRALLAAKLNKVIGSTDSQIANIIAEADAWMMDHPVGSGVAASSAEWQAARHLAETLDAYNRGFLFAPLVRAAV